MKSLVAAALFSVACATNSSSLGLLSSGNVDLGDWADAYTKAKALVSNMTMAEKISVITGGSVSGVWNALQYKDGTQGVQQSYTVSGFSQASTLSFTFDKDLMYQQGQAVGKEFFLRGYQVINGPTSQPLGRTPWGGRLGETLGTDPYLNGVAFGQLAKAFVSQGVIPAGKHFLLNEQETNRDSSPPYSSNADDKTIHETYLWPFYDAVKNGLGGVMCAMNMVNGSYSCESSLLLNDLLKTQVGFPGQVFGDVNAQHTALGSANGGLDYGSSSLWTESTLSTAIANGSFTADRLDDMAIRNAMPYYYVGLDTANQASTASNGDYRDVRANHSKIIRTVGAASLVLLKNTGGLPLDRPESIAMFGAHAGPIMAGPNMAFSVSGSGPTYQGHLASGSGSGQDSFSYLITPFQSIVAQAALDGSMINWLMNDTYTSTSSGMGGGGGMGGAPSGGMGGNATSSGSASAPSGASGAPGGSSSSNSTDAGAGGSSSSSSSSTAAINAQLQTGTSISASISGYAAVASACLVFLNALAGEGADRTELYNTDQDTLVTTVAANCNNTIVIINTVGPRLVDAWIDNDNVTAVVYGSLLGQESGNSIADVLYGTVNPSGRLIYTIAKNESDYDVTICETDDCDFTEGNYIDYKGFENRNVTPRYAFGHGLSYTTFNYSALAVESLSTSANSTGITAGAISGTIAPGGITALWDDVMNVTVTISNTGSVSGAEVPQLYLSYPAAAAQPAKQLRGFEKVGPIAAGQTADATFTLHRRDLAYWDVQAQAWTIASGSYGVMVGASSSDIRVTTTFTV